MFMLWNTALFLLTTAICLSAAGETIAGTQNDRGRTIYTEYCLRCHGTEGQGPASIQKKEVWNKPVDELIRIVTFGARGSMSMKNGTRRGMPASPYSDADIAQVTMYVAQLVANKDVVITDQDVQRVRRIHGKTVRQKFGASQSLSQQNAK